ncbi:hypothetical protein cyc_04585 [Cyclospora cayetanensis]|uniref:Uncharacterized protein n=1 Tax=Cyclospora cayetanensis TaxID=88456 RepID=A0A1D3DAS5_9EIME|nr:hypothetical protein cyc_04585 [Cyclospora cayetanensis]
METAEIHTALQDIQDASEDVLAQEGAHSHKNVETVWGKFTEQTKGCQADEIDRDNAIGVIRGCSHSRNAANHQQQSRGGGVAPPHWKQGWASTVLNADLNESELEGTAETGVRKYSHG